MMDVLEQEMQEVYMNIHEKHHQCMGLLEEVRERISRTEFSDKEDIIGRIKDRKILLLNNVREVFKEILVKEQNVAEGSLSLSQLLYSAEICASSSERLADEEELKQDKIKLIRHLQNKLQLKLDRGEHKGEVSEEGGSSSSPSRYEIKNPPILDGDHPQPEIDLACEEKRPKGPVVIPAIMTKDKREQLERERNIQQQKWA